jgi:hypothetical protein
MRRQTKNEINIYIKSLYKLSNKRIKKLSPYHQTNIIDLLLTLQSGPLADLEPTKKVEDRPMG